MIWYYFSGILADFLSSQTNFLFWPALVVMYGATRQEAGKIYWFALIVGILFDLILGKTLGLTSVILLISGGVIYFLQARFSRNLTLPIVAIIIVQILYKLANY